MQDQQLELQPLETHETDWAPDSVDVTLNVQLDAAFVPSMTEGTRLDMAHLLVLDNFITDEHRQQLLDAITAPAWQGCDPPQPKWERATCDGAGLPATWGLSDSALKELASSCLPAKLEVQSRLCKLYPDVVIAHMPSDRMQPWRWGGTEPVGASHGESAGGTMQLQQQQEGSQQQRRQQEWQQEQQRECQEERQQEEQQADGESAGALHQALAQATQAGSTSQVSDEPQDCANRPAGQQTDPQCLAPSDRCSNGEQQQPSSCRAAAEPPDSKPGGAGGEQPGSLSTPSVDANQFVANAAVYGDQFQWHVDADPSEFADSAWTEHYGRYFNREPGQPLFFSLLLYLDATWPRENNAETLFLDTPSDTGIFIRPKPCRAVLMDQDIVHRLSTPSQHAARPRYSLVFKLVMLPKVPGQRCCLSLPQWGRPAAFGSAAKADMLVRQMARKRKAAEVGADGAQAMAR